MATDPPHHAALLSLPELATATELARAIGGEQGERVVGGQLGEEQQPGGGRVASRTDGRSSSGGRPAQVKDKRLKRGVEAAEEHQDGLRVGRGEAAEEH
uniref:Uncharacterized protein n=1 Tax=Arundo donax TaxID=35708 RepID=A0A0A9GEU8_ARUDO